LSKDENNRFIMSKVILIPHLIIDKEEDLEKAERILQKAEKACLITNSIKSEVELQSHVMVAEPVA
jgi:organic hydroperoxide reductase OsmC/OhrA